MEEGRRAPSHVVLIPSPGMGHLIPLTEFAKRLLPWHHLSTTVITFSAFTSVAEQSLLTSLPASISTISVPNIRHDDLGSKGGTENKLGDAIMASFPFLRTILVNLKEQAPVVALVTDIITIGVHLVARELGLPAFVFFTTTIMYLTLFLDLPTIYTQTNDDENLIHLPGNVPFRAKDLPELVRDRSHPLHPFLMDICELYLKADGILVNSFESLESAAYNRLRARGERVYAIGPIIRCHSSKDGSAECMKWLERHPCRSVVFVSFGTLVQISGRQVEELAYGLESSGQRFLWLLPADGDCEKYLPEGFLERTRDVGMVVGSWVPQAAVMNHGAVGGFVSHGGWNSTLESLANGVPMVVWPIQYDQRINAVLLMEGLGVALRVEASAEEDGFVCRVAVEEILKELMEGERGKALRARAAELQEKAKKATGEDGSSWKTLAEVVSLWEGNRRPVISSN